MEGFLASPGWCALRSAPYELLREGEAPLLARLTEQRKQADCLDRIAINIHSLCGAFPRGLLGSPGSGSRSSVSSSVTSLRIGVVVFAAALFAVGAG